MELPQVLQTLALTLYGPWRTWGNLEPGSQDSLLVSRWECLLRKSVIDAGLGQKVSAEGAPGHSRSGQVLGSISGPKGMGSTSNFQEP